MFTNLPSRIVFIDKDDYISEEWLGHWMAHELGHLASNSARQEDAEKAAREFRRRLTLIDPISVQITSDGVPGDWLA